MKSPVQLLIAFAIMLATATVFAQVYRWVDKDGKVNYTDTPPPKDTKGEAKKVELKPSSATSDGVDRFKATQKNLSEIDKRRTEAAKAAEKASEARSINEQNAEACKDARRNLAEYDSGRPLTTTDDAGERKVMSDEDRAASVRRMQAIIAQTCR